MERLNWAVLGLIGIVTALGLATSSSAGKTQSDAQPVSVTATPACSACEAGGACCNKSLNKKDSIVSITRTGETFDVTASEDHKSDSKVWIDVPNGVVINKTRGLIQDLDKPVCEGECPLCKKTDEVPNLDQALAPRSGLVEQCNPTNGTTDCPLTKAADAIASLTKQYVCEGGECLTKPGQVELAIGAADPNVIELTAKPDGLSNLLAAAEAVKTEQPAGTITVDEFPIENATIATEPSLTTAEGLKAIEDLVKNKKASTTTQSAEKMESKTTDTKPAEKTHAVDNSRAASRAAKLAKLEAKLEAPWDFEIEKITVEELASAVQQKYGVPVIIDRKALEEAAFDIIAPKISVTKQPEIEAGEYLRGVLRDQALTWIIPASNDRVLITTMTAMENTPIRRVYEVTDLIGEDPETLLQQLQSVLTPITWVDGHSSNLIIRNNGPRYYLMATHDYWSQHELKMLIEDLRLQNTAK